MKKLSYNQIKTFFFGAIIVLVFIFVSCDKNKKRIEPYVAPVTPTETLKGAAAMAAKLKGIWYWDSTIIKDQVKHTFNTLQLMVDSSGSHSVTCTGIFGLSIEFTNNPYSGQGNGSGYSDSYAATTNNMGQNHADLKLDSKKGNGMVESTTGWNWLVYPFSDNSKFHLYMSGDSVFHHPCSTVDLAVFPGSLYTIDLISNDVLLLSRIDSTSTFLARETKYYFRR